MSNIIYLHGKDKITFSKKEMEKAGFPWRQVKYLNKKGILSAYYKVDMKTAMIIHLWNEITKKQNNKYFREYDARSAAEAINLVFQKMEGDEERLLNTSYVFNKKAFLFFEGDMVCSTSEETPVFFTGNFEKLKDILKERNEFK